LVVQKCIVNLQYNNETMEIKLTETAIKAIRQNGVLYGEVADELEVKPASLARVLNNNDKRLTQAGIVKIIKKHNPGLKDRQILSNSAL